MRVLSVFGGETGGDGDIDGDAMAATDEGDGVRPAVGSTDADGDAVGLAIEEAVQPDRLAMAITTVIRHGA